jgi:hypothetical protein
MTSKEKLKEDLDRMYRELTDPEEQAKRRMIKSRQKQVEEAQADYGL